MPRCPSCFVRLTFVKEGPTVVKKTCPNCFGVWIERIRLLHIARNPINISPQAQVASIDKIPTAIPDGPDRPASLADLATVVAESDTQKQLACPECHHVMNIERFHPMIPINIQSCHRCQSVWLDVGKLELIARLYHELTVSTDPKIVDLREKYAMAGLGMEQLREKDLSVAQTLARTCATANAVLGLPFSGMNPP